MIRQLSITGMALLLLLCVALSGCGGSSSAPKLTLSPSGAQMVDQGQSMNFTVQDTSGQGVTWSLHSFGTLSNISKTSVTYSAPATVAAAETDHLVATSVMDPSVSVTIAINLMPPPVITISSLPDGTNATAYSQQVQTSGGVGVLAYTVTAGALPAGLTMNSSGLISGKPTGSNVTANFTITVSDQGTPPLQAMKALSIHIAPPPALVFSSASPLPAGTTNVAYNSNGAVATTGGIAPVTFAITSGALPHGMLISSSTGLISGTPDTTANNFGTFNFTVTATDSAIPPQTPSKPFSLTINPPMLGITSTTLPNGQIGFAYNAAVQTMGGFPPLAFSISAGALPTSLSINQATGAITGMPTVSNVFNFTVQVQDAAAQMTSQAYSVTIAPAIAVTLSTPPPASLQAGLTAQIAATASNDAGNKGVDWSVSCGSAGACGSFNPAHTASGAMTTYTAPAAVPTGGTVTITATSTADPTKSVAGNPTTITLPPIIVTLTGTQPPAALQVNTSAMVTAHVANDGTNAGVDWSVTCGSAACGSFSLSHTASDAATSYTAPATVPTGTTVTIKATSTANNTKSVSAVITITIAPAITVTFVMAPPSTLQVSNTATVSAHVANDGTNAGVDWSVACGSAGACGSFTSAHTASDVTTTYTAPAAVPTGNTVTIKATSTADNTKSASGSPTTITAPVIMIVFTDAPPASAAVNSMTMMSSTVTNDSMNKGVDWTVTCGSASCGSFNPTHTASGASTTYTAPASVPTGNTVTIKAASTADSTRFVTQSVTITSGSNLGKLSGAYVFEFEGWNTSDITMMAVVGKFTADGSGNITGGVEDVNRFLNVFTNLAITSGSYTVGADDRGTLTLTTSHGSSTYKFALLANGTLKFIEFDSTGTRGSGIAKPQGSGPLANDYAFLLAGNDASSHRVGVAGRLTASGGSFSGAVVDVSVPGNSFNNLPASGTYTAPDANGRATATMSFTISGVGTVNLNLAMYFPTSSAGSGGEVYVIDVDSRNTPSPPALVGQMLRQTGAGSFSNASLTGNAVFAVTGYDTSHAISNTAIGQVTLDGNGNLTGILDQAADGMIVADTAFTGNYSISSNGRGTVTFVVNPVDSRPQAVYLIDAQHAFILEAGSGNDVTTGTLETQGSGYSNSTLSGTYTFAATEPVTTNVNDFCGVFTVTGSGTATGTQDYNNSNGTNTPNQALSFTFNIAANGRGTMAITPAGGSAANVILWIISPTRILAINADVATTDSAVVVIDQ